MAAAGSGHATIAYFTTFLGSQINKSRFEGIGSILTSAGANVFCFVTRTINEPDGFKRQSNILADFVSPEYFDGLIVGNIFMENITSDETSAAFFSKYALPVITIRENSAGLPFIPIDNSGGISGMMTHLIEVHGCRRIIYVRGPEKNPYAEARFRAYHDTLEAHGFAFDDKMVTPPGTWWKSGIETMLDERGYVPGRDFDAVVCPNDHLAREVVIILQKRGFGIPRDVKVTGFNNDRQCSVYAPTLSSVQMPFLQQGQAVARLLLHLLEHDAAAVSEDDPLVQALPAQLVFRDSCGCSEDAFQDFDIEESAQTVSGDAVLQEKINESFRPLLANEVLTPDEGDELTTLFYGVCTGNTAPSDFFSLFRHVLNKKECSEKYIVILRGWYAQLRAGTIPRIAGRTLVVRLETLYKKIQMYISSLERRLLETGMLESPKLYYTVRQIGVSLFSTFNISEIMDDLSKGCEKLGIDTCYVALYENPGQPVTMSRMVLAIREGTRLQIEKDGMLFPTREVIPLDMRPTNQPYSIVVASLYFRTQQIGFICYSMTQMDRVVYDMLIDQLSNALQIALSIRDLDATRSALAVQARELARSNEELEQFAYIASHDLREPLRKIIAMSDRIITLEDRRDTVDIGDYLHRMQRAAYRMQNLIDDLLDYSRVGRKPHPFEQLDLKTLCAQVLVDLELAIKRNGAAVQIDDMPVIDAEPIQMRQLFQNLIGNALKFRRENVPPHIRIFSESSGDGWCLIQIADNGIGINPEFRDRIFGVFERLHSINEYEGSGIGLSICKKIVDYHQGEITVESIEGEGTTFVIRLPCVQKG
ncbi:MAG: substrate-binding domain-containing protein [Spirochaetales bacterium]|nr:substrate-binding domain-containing protein [Spirochaetales bacterium]